MLKAKRSTAAVPTLTDRARVKKETTAQKRLNVDLDKDIYDAFNILGIKKGFKMATEVRKWIEDYVKKNGKE